MAVSPRVAAAAASLLAPDTRHLRSTQRPEPRCSGFTVPWMSQPRSIESFAQVADSTADDSGVAAANAFGITLDDAAQRNHRHRDHTPWSLKEYNILFGLLWQIPFLAGFNWLVE